MTNDTEAQALIDELAAKGLEYFFQRDMDEYAERILAAASKPKGPWPFTIERGDASLVLCEEPPLGYNMTISGSNVTSNYGTMDLAPEHIDKLLVALCEHRGIDLEVVYRAASSEMVSNLSDWTDEEAAMLGNIRAVLDNAKAGDAQ